ncbi:hypothetical protein K1T35_48565 (plasmid) [Pseudonocardia sp. DSM 110487]|uniref:hypothetical protein n=1 Tax=Pseudonocardia sp. DSM 110487 TaxID=2865833 RepID=UPI001C6A8176|nr:hypothetical protein [Pseudonocardia sp. DSM 110487]QYN41202.1 hypothetical protein K1T35_48565 [Pseudonocardia sp. DSM 110487]
MADRISQETEDAIVNTIVTRLVVDKGMTCEQIYGDCAPGDQRLIEESLDRHAARQRAAGKPGW